ncbi:MAG: hypothetical protein E7384_04605 [Ruminococcaceae bacterium]|nr:hypothetical protein [Oscillospiraceae bacterium]
MKRILTFILCGIMSLCFAACNGGDTNKTYDKLFDTYPSVFVTENITSITFYAYYGEGKGSKVPTENMTEIINWLDSFTIDRVATDEDILDGTNTRFVEIEYSDGTIIKEGLDIINIDGTRYLLKKEPYPDCFTKIISKTTL